MCSPSVYANPGCPARDSCDLLALLALLQGPHRVTDRLVMILLSHHDLPATDGQRPNRPAEGRVVANSRRTRPRSSSGPNTHAGRRGLLTRRASGSGPRVALTPMAPSSRSS